MWKFRNSNLLILCGIILQFFQIQGQSVNRCSFRINGGLAEPQPLILTAGTGSHFAYPLPSYSFNVTVNAGDSIRLACPGNRFAFDVDETKRKIYDITLKCIGDTKFSLQNVVTFRKYVNLADLVCENYPLQRIRRARRISYDVNIYEVGYELGRNEFQKLFEAWHSDSLSHTFLTYSKIVAAIGAAQKKYPRRTFRTDGLFKDVPIFDVYRAENQLERLKNLLGSSSFVINRIYQLDGIHLAKGHLVAKADFVYGSQQRSTFTYINTVPMWSTVNSGNWEKIERSVRKYASENEVDLDVYTGTIGVLALPDVNNIYKEIYLHEDENGHFAVPVPRVLFKVVYNKSNRAGIVFLTINDPFTRGIKHEDILCNNISYMINYVKWVPYNSTEGLSYCCEVDEFRRSFPALPAFTTSSILQ